MADAMEAARLSISITFPVRHLSLTFMPETPRLIGAALARLGTDRRFVGDPRRPPKPPRPKSPTVTSPLPQDESRHKNQTP